MLADVKVPVLIWLGEEDVFVPLEMGEDMAARLPDAQLTLVPSAGHLGINRWDDVLGVSTPRF